MSRNNPPHRTLASDSRVIVCRRRLRCAMESATPGARCSAKIVLQPCGKVRTPGLLGGGNQVPLHGCGLLEPPYLGEGHPKRFATSVL